MVVAERLGKYSETPASTDAAGRFEMVVPEDRYKFSVRAKDRVCIAITDRECVAGETLELPPFQLIERRIHRRSGRQRLNRPADRRHRRRRSRSSSASSARRSRWEKRFRPSRMATVDQAGRYTVRAAPGENFPYFVNFHGDRMAWNTTKQPAVVVKEGETTELQHARHAKDSS